ncbi:hypothetical protein [Pseudorhodobacter sp.]|uniref:hypothetical protein n=1 Tax=Pseudorhodobacter sp. TaxID=1934400 RepID=UPI00264888BD|nr:hypothetical protein [Pseudorhodobacter sp.]MDN5787661.1 hypothetical protein [Pseudorhodobacter sp.]
MKIKTLFACTALCLSPGLAFAMCSGEAHAAAISCADGLVFVGATNTCEPVSG